MKLKISKTFTGSVDRKEFFSDDESKAIWGGGAIPPNDLLFTVTCGKLPLSICGVRVSCDASKIRKYAQFLVEVAKAIEEGE